MAHSKYRVFEEERNTLYLSMDGDNRLTGDPKEIERIMERKKRTDIRIYRMLTGAADSDEFSESEEDAVDDRPKVKLIVEEVLPDGAEDDKPPDPVADFVDPLSQLDTEQMLRLKTALASEQAKQILGDNVTAMLDVLSVDDTAFLRNSIMQDHCYTPLSPSEDPRGPSFVQANNPPELVRRPVGRPPKHLDRPKPSTVVRSDNASPLMPDSDDQAQDDNDKEYADTPEDSETDGEDGSDSDYRDRNSVGFGVRTRKRGGARTRGSSFRGRHKRNSGRSPRREREREELPKEVKPQQPLVVTKIARNQPPMKRGRARRGGSTPSPRLPTVTKGPTVPSSPALEPELPVDHVAAKMYSNDAIRLGRSNKTDEERRKDIVRVLQNLPFSQKSRTILTGTKTQAVQPAKPASSPVASTSKIEFKPKAEEDVKKAVDTPVKNVMGGKYPRRENRKLPSHLADSIGPEIFSMPDLLRRKPAQLVEGIKPKPAAKAHQNPVHKYINKTKVETAAKEQSTDDLTANMATTVNDLQCMLEEGLNEPTSADNTLAANALNDEPSSETNNQVTDSNTTNELKPTDESVDISQMEQLQELPVANLDEILQSVAAQETKPELKESPTHEGIGSDSGENNSQSGEGSSAVSERRRSVPKRRRSDEISSLEDSDIDDVLSEGSWNSDDDPDKLWCICRQPHNNRFMICCDVCEEWFHGKCVGIPKSIGKQMERDNLEWSCPDCRDKKSGDDKARLEKNVKPKLQQTKLVTFTKRPSAEQTSIRKCIMCKAPARENSIYCSDQCISKHSQKALSQLNESTKVGGKTTEESIAPRRIIVLDPTNKQLLTGQSAPTVANLATWLLKNPSYRVFNSKDAQLHSPNDMRNVRKVVQIKPYSLDAKKQMTLAISPNSKIVKVNHANSPVLKVISPGTGMKNQVVSLIKGDSEAHTKARSESLKTDRKIVEATKLQPRRRKEKEQPIATSSKTESARERGNERAVRDSVRRTLGESLKSRVDECDDLQVNYADIEDLAAQIEERLYDHFENKVDAKYKSKFRSLVFNIKDQKNKTLFRKIVEKAISPKELVRLSPDEMASQELAQWREKENQHQLEIIKKSELELMTQGQTFIIKSRKGEEFIEKVQNVGAEIDPNTSAQELVSALNSVSSTTPDNSAVEKTKKNETSLMKMKKREKEKRRERENRRKRSRSRSRSRTSKRSKPSKKRSRSRSKDRRRRSSDKKESDTRSSRHSRDSEKVREKEVEKEPEKEVEEPVKEEAVEITTSEDVEQKIKDPAAEETDFEPTSTVTIKTPDPQVDEIEEPEANPVWSGQIIMAEVAKFRGHALPAAGECESISGDVGEKLSIIGRIGYSNVWDYLVKMKLSASKEILLLQILPKDNEQDISAFSHLHSYLEKRSRIAVIKPANDRVKDFYLYPHKEGSAIPQHLQPITIPLRFEKGCMLFGIVVRTKKGTRSAATLQKYASPLFKVPLPPRSPESVTKSKISQLPLPEPPSAHKQKLDSKNKKKVRVLVQPKSDGGDSPYSPASSDEDLPPLQITKKLPETDIAPIETDEIQKKIDEMNRAIEEQTQQIQCLASTVPLLPVIAPVLAASFPAGTADVASLNSSLKALTSILTTPMETDCEIIDLDKSPQSIPMEIDDPLPTTSEPVMSEGEPYSPSGSLSPTPEEEPPVATPLVLPQEVAKISIPSNLQEILASIKQSAPEPPEVAPSPPSSPKSSPRADGSPEPLPPGVDMLDSPPEPPKIVKPDDDDEAPPVKITPKKPIKFDIKINQKTKVMLAEAANDHFLSRTDRDERFIPGTGAPDEKTEKPTPDTEPKPAPAHRTLSSKDDRRARHFGRRADAHKSDRHRDQDRKELEAEWDGSIRKFENESRRRHREIREKEIERLRKRSDSE